MVEIVKLVRDQHGELHVDGKLRTWKLVAQLIQEDTYASGTPQRLHGKARKPLIKNHTELNPNYYNTTIELESSGRLRLREKVAGLFSWMVGRPERINQ